MSGPPIIPCPFPELDGATILTTDYEVDEDFGELWPTLHVVAKDGTKFVVHVSTDPEGNGPGHLFIEEVVVT